MESNEKRIQEIIFEYFEGYDDKEVVNMTEAFVYHGVPEDSKTAEMLQTFLDENGLAQAWLSYLHDLKPENKHQSFTRSSRTEVEMINLVSFALLSLVYNRYRQALVKKEKRNQAGRRNFNFMKEQLLSVLRVMNGYEHYFYSKEEDAELTKKVKGIKYGED